MSQPLADERSALIAELRALIPEARGQRKRVELSIHLDFDFLPARVEVLVTVRDPNANAIDTAAVMVDACLHRRGSSGHWVRTFPALFDQASVVPVPRPPPSSR